MVKKSFNTLLILILLLAIASTSFAQRQAGSISGVVTDEEGEPLPGVSITLTGPNIMGTLSYMS